MNTFPAEHAEPAVFAVPDTLEVTSEAGVPPVSAPARVGHAALSGAVTHTADRYMGPPRAAKTLLATVAAMETQQGVVI